MPNENVNKGFLFDNPAYFKHDGVEGVRDGLGWTLAIAEDTGKAVLTASGDKVGFVIFGACTPL